MEVKKRLSRYINYIRRTKEAKMALFYSVFYFVFITLLLTYGTIMGAKTQDNYHIKNKHHEIFVPTAEDIEIAIYKTAS
jgi:hypothetical protein